VSPFKYTLKREQCLQNHSNPISICMSAVLKLNIIYMIFWYTIPAKLGSARPNTDCLAASNQWHLCKKKCWPVWAVAVRKKSIITHRHAQ